MDDLLEAGEFSIDLYTMPDSLTSKLWDFFVSTYTYPIHPMGQLLTNGLQAKRGLVT